MLSILRLELTQNHPLGLSLRDIMADEKRALHHREVSGAIFDAFWLALAVKRRRDQGDSRSLTPSDHTD